MNRTFQIFLRAIFAALLVSGAAFRVPAQDKSAVKDDSRCEPQTIALKAAVKDKAPAVVVQYVYEFTQPDFYVRHIKIEHNATGRGKISFERKGLDEPLVEDFELSPAARARITGLWDALGFIDSTANYQSEKQFPHLGTMCLAMKRGERERTAVFNWTNDRNAFALVNEYRRAADQAIFVFDINVAREHEPLETPKLLDQLDSLLNRNALSDPQQLLALLRDLNTDERIPLIARNHAARLTKKIEGKSNAKS
jgi:hypothetical protein